MLVAIARKELLNHLASFRFWVGALLTVVLASSSTLVAARDYELRLRSYDERIASHEKALRDVSVYSYLQPQVIRPPEPLSVLDQGFDSRLGTAVAIHLSSIPNAATGGQRGNEFLVSLPTVDLTTIVTVVLGLLALLLTHDAILGEREDGTLRALFAHAVARRTVLAGKLIGGLLTLGLPLGMGLLVSLALWDREVRIALTPEQWLRVAGLVAAYGVYLSLMLLLGLVISLHVRSTSRALGFAVLLWLLITIILPDVAWAVATDLGGTAGTQGSAERAIAALTARHQGRLARELRRDPLRTEFSGHTPISFANGEHGAVRYRSGSSAYYDSLAEYYRFEVESGLRQATEVFTVQKREDERLRRGERLGIRLASISPAFLLARLSESFTGTSVADYDQFLEACRLYRLEVRDYLARKNAYRSWRWFTDDPPGGLRPWPGYLGLTPEAVDPARVRSLFTRLSEPAIDAGVRRDRQRIERDPSRHLQLRDMPRFTFHGPTFLAALRNGAAEAGALLFFNLVVAAAAWRRFGRYDVG